MKDYKQLAIFESLIELANARQSKNDGDYVNPGDGLLYCGRCGAPKQYRLEKFPKYIVPISCECERRADEERAREKQARENAELIRTLRGASLMDERFREQTFESFRVTQDNTRALKLARRYADGFDEMRKRNQGLLLWGDVGTGKTFTAACIANALLDRGVSVIMTSFVRLLGLNDDELIERLNRAELLIIDDLGAERSTDYALERIYGMIDRRYRSRLPMILTTNLSLGEMKQVTDIRYSRIYDRIFEVCYPVRFTGPSFRRAEANRRYSEMKSLLEGDDTDG